MPTILTSGQLPERIAGKSEYSPIVERLCADTLVEIDCKLIPVEHCPLESAAVSLESDLRERGKERKANSFTSCFGPNEEILEVNPALSEEGRVIVKEESETHRLFIYASDDHFCRRPIGEKRFAKLLFGRYARVAKSLVFRETLNEFQNEWNVRLDRGPNLNRIRQSPGPR